jgi:DNA-binding FadR family transcriptional regulator
MVRTKLHEQARQGIERLIKKRALTPGSKLPTESNLASELYVSRGTIRNALNLLEQEGKIEHRTHTRAMDNRPPSRIARPCPAHRLDALTTGCGVATETTGSSATERSLQGSP